MKTRHLSTTSNNVNDVNFMKRLFSSFTKMKIQLTFEVVAMGTSSFALRISWIKFEPKVSILAMKAKVCCRPLLLQLGSLSLKRTLIIIRPKEKTLHSSISNIICTGRLYYREIRDLGSNFRHETAKLFAAVRCYYKAKSISNILAFVDPLHHIVSDKLNQEHKN